MGSLGLVIESLVSVLLAVTIGYCILLNRRLKAMRTDDASMRRTIGELIAATDTAERAVAGLKRTIAEQDQTLANRLLEAEAVSRQLDDSVGDGEEILHRLTLITAAARPARQARERQEAEDAGDDERSSAPAATTVAERLADIRHLRRGVAA